MAAPLPSLPELESLVARLVSPEQLPPQALSELLQDADRLLPGLQRLQHVDLEAAEAFLRGAAGSCTTLASLTLPPWAEAPSSPELQGPEGLQGLASLCWRAAAASGVAAALLHPLKDKALCERLGTSLAYRLASGSSVIFGPAVRAVHLLQQAAAHLPQSPQQRCAPGLEALLMGVLEAASGALAFFSAHHESRLGAALRSTVFKLPMLNRFMLGLTEVLYHIEQSSGRAAHNSRLWRALRAIHLSLYNGNVRDLLPARQESTIVELSMGRHRVLLRELSRRGMRPGASWGQRWGDMAHVLAAYIVPCDEGMLSELGAALLGLLPRLSSEPLSTRLCLSMLGQLSDALIKHARARGALPARRLVSLLEAGTLFAAGTMASLEAARLGDTGVDAVNVRLLAESSMHELTTWGAGIRGLLEPDFLGLVQEKVCKACRPEFHEAHVPAAAVEAAEALIRLAGRLLEEVHGNLDNLSTLVAAARALLELGQLLKGGDRAYLQASSNAATSAAKLVLKVHELLAAQQSTLGSDIHLRGSLGTLLSALLRMAAAAAWIDLRALAPSDAEGATRHNDALLVTIMPAARALAHFSVPGQANSSSSRRARTAGAAPSAYWCWYNLVWVDATLKNQGAEASTLDALGWSEALAAACLASLACSPTEAKNTLEASADCLDIGSAFHNLGQTIFRSPRFGAMLAACGYFEGLIKWVQQVVTGMSKRQAAKVLGDTALAKLRSLVMAACHTLHLAACPARSPQVKAWWILCGQFCQMPADQLHSKHVWAGLVGKELLPPMLAWAKDLEVARQSSMQHDQQRVQERAAAALQLRRCAFLGCTNLAGCSEGRLSVRRCGGCGQVTFCSRQCQLAAWGEHSKVCKSGDA